MEAGVCRLPYSKRTQQWVQLGVNPPRRLLCRKLTAITCRTPTPNTNTNKNTITNPPRPEEHRNCCDCRYFIEKQHD